MTEKEELKQEILDMRTELQKSQQLLARIYNNLAIVEKKVDNLPK